MTVEKISPVKYRLHADGQLIGVLRVSPNFAVHTGHAAQSLQSMFVVREKLDLEIVGQVVRRPHTHMPIPGKFDRNGRLIGPAGPPPYPNHTHVQDFDRT